MTSVWIGRGLTALTVLFLVFDGVMKVVKPPFIVEANVPLGVPERLLVGIGVTLLVCTALYGIPATSLLGAVLLTGYLGGAARRRSRPIHAPRRTGCTPIAYASARRRYCAVRLC